MIYLGLARTEAILFLQKSRAGRKDLGTGDVLEIHHSPELMFELAERVATKLKDFYRLGMIQNEWGRFNASVGNFGAAFPLFSRAERNFKRVDNIYYQISVYVNRAEAHCWNRNIGVSVLTSVLEEIIHAEALLPLVRWPANHAILLKLTQAYAWLLEHVPANASNFNWEKGGTAINYWIEAINILLNDQYYAQNKIFSQRIVRKLLAQIEEYRDNSDLEIAWALGEGLRTRLDLLKIDGVIKSDLTRRLEELRDDIATQLPATRLTNIRSSLDRYNRNLLY